MTYRPCGKCIGPECLCHEVEPEKLDGRTIQEWAHIARGFGEKSDRLEAERDALRYYATALRLHWHTSRDPFWDGNLEDLDRAVPPPDCWRRHDQNQETR